MQKQIILQGILYDDKSSYLRGPALAPPAIREAFHSNSANYFSESGLELLSGIYEDKGDFTISDYFAIEEITINNLDKGRPLISLGGDHSITYPLLKAFHHLYGKIEILHIDAHADLYDEFEGDKYSHACPFARIMEDGMATRLLQVGIRTLSGHQRVQAKKYGVEIIEMKGFDVKNIPVLNGPVYISLDMDALDPAFVPGVSHQEPGGLSTRQVIDIIQAIKAPIIGGDIVELNPARDINNMSAMVCAKLLKEISAKMIENKR